MSHNLHRCHTRPFVTRERIALMRRAVRLYCSEYVSREVNRANRIAWLRAVERLGDKWLLAQPVERQEVTQ
jgi:hypothetical protein